MEKSTPAIERLKAGEVRKFTVCGKEFQTLMTFQCLDISPKLLNPGAATA